MLTYAADVCSRMYAADVCSRMFYLRPPSGGGEVDLPMDNARMRLKYKRPEEFGDAGNLGGAHLIKGVA